MEQSVELSGGRIYYREEGQGEPLLFVHGLFVDGRLWRKVIPDLRSDFRCIVPDWPLGSHREALRVDADRSPRAIAGLIAEFISALELNKVTIVANDTGGAISQMLAADHPASVRALVLTNCDCLENFLPPFFRPLQWLAHIPGAYWLIAELLRSRSLRRSRLGFGMLSHEPLPDELSAAWVAPLHDRRVRADLTATLRAIDKRDTLAAAKTLHEHPLPLLLAWASEDRFFPLRYAERLARMIPGTHIKPIADSRAFVPQDQPRRLAELVRGFLSELDREAPKQASTGV